MDATNNAWRTLLSRKEEEGQGLGARASWLCDWVFGWILRRSVYWDICRRVLLCCVQVLEATVFFGEVWEHLSRELCAKQGGDFFLFLWEEVVVHNGLGDMANRSICCSWLHNSCFALVDKISESCKHCHERPTCHYHRRFQRDWSRSGAAGCSWGSRRYLSYCSWPRKTGSCSSFCTRVLQAEAFRHISQTTGTTWSMR